MTIWVHWEGTCRCKQEAEVAAWLEKGYRRAAMRRRQANNEVELFLRVKHEVANVVENIDLRVTQGRTGET